MDKKCEMDFCNTILRILGQILLYKLRLFTINLSMSIQSVAYCFYRPEVLGGPLLLAFPSASCSCNSPESCQLKGRGA